jgi:hypothetical protein
MHMIINVTVSFFILLIQVLLIQVLGFV